MTNYPEKPVYVWRSLSRSGIIGFAGQPDQPDFASADWLASGLVDNAGLPASAIRVAKRKVAAGFVFRGYLDSDGNFNR